MEYLSFLRAILCNLILPFIFFLILFIFFIFAFRLFVYFIIRNLFVFLVGDLKFGKLEDKQ
jgi:membrane protein insertase Oxa1/YidC/SpoIIIJ